MLTDRTNLFFKRSIFAVSLLETHRPEAPQLLYASKGIFTEFPIVDAKQVIKQQGAGFESLYRTHEQTRAICEKYLASQGMYVVKFGPPEQRGVRFLETDNWRVTVPGYIAQMKAQNIIVEELDTAVARIEAVERELAAEEGGQNANTGA
jgi:hypothetical protein